MNATRILKPEPPVREDGKCSYCGKKKPVPEPSQRALKELYQREIDSDPFCSTKCCREYFGTEWNPPPDTRNMSRRYTE